MIIALALVWYGIVPLTGAIVSRHTWRRFRRRFNDLRTRPVLDYDACQRLDGDAGVFRFTGGFESLADEQIMWIKGENLTIPVSLADAQIYLLPMQGASASPREAPRAADSREGAIFVEDFDPDEEAPEAIRWDRISALTEGAKVFAGGALTFSKGRWMFVSSKETPLLVVFYDGPERSLTHRAIRAGRGRNEYWNSATPYSIIVGAVCLILMAASFLTRPAFRLTAITAFVAVFIPLYPLLPPGLLFGIIYRYLSWRARKFRAYRDLSGLPLRCLAPEQESSILPNGEMYGMMRCGSLPDTAQELPALLPGFFKKRPGTEWYAFGALHPQETLPREPKDPFASFGILPGKPEVLARRYAIRAYTLEIIAWLALLAGIGLNIFFIRMILSLL